MDLSISFEASMYDKPYKGFLPDSPPGANKILSQLAEILATGYVRLVSSEISPQGGTRAATGPRNPEELPISGQKGLDVSPHPSDGCDRVVNRRRAP